MKSSLDIKTPEDLIIFLKEHNLNGIITDFTLTNNGELSAFGFPTTFNISLSMDCHIKDGETDTVKEMCDNLVEAEKVI